jgi:hypothetical protein
LSKVVRHPEAGAELQATVAAVVDRCRRCVAEAVEGVEPASRAFALCLLPSDEPSELAPVNIALGLESDRERALGRATWLDAFDDAWNPTRYAYISLDEFDDPPWGARLRRCRLGPRLLAG